MRRLNIPALLFTGLMISCSSPAFAACELLQEPRSASIGSDEIYEQLLKYEQCLADAIDSVASVYHQFGRTHEERDQHPDAISQYTKALEINPGYVDAYINRSRSYYALRDYTTALSDLEAAIDRAPNDVRAHYYKGITYMKMKRYEHAVAVFDSARPMSNDPGRLAKLLYQKGLAHKYLQQSDDALSAFSEAISHDDAFVEAYFSRALNSQQRGTWTEAVADYSQVIRLQPENAAAYFNRGIVYQKLDKDSLAVRDYSAALKINPVYMRARVRKSLSFIIPLVPVILVLVLG